MKTHIYTHTYIERETHTRAARTCQVQTSSAFAASNSGGGGAAAQLLGEMGRYGILLHEDVRGTRVTRRASSIYRARIGFDLSQTQKTSRFHSGHFRAFMRAGSMIAPMDYGPRGVHVVQLLQRKGGARTHDHLLVRKWFGIPIFNTNILIENLSIFEKCLHHIIVRN